MKSMIEKIKEQGVINIEELSTKQLLALVNMWSWNFIKKENYSFSDMLKKCYKSKPWHENADILYVNEKNNSALNIEHAFHDMYEGEEKELLNILKQTLKKI